MSFRIKKTTLSNISIGGGGDPALRSELYGEEGSSIIGFSWDNIPSEIDKVDWGIHTANNAVSVFRFIPPSEWTAITNKTSTTDVGAYINQAGQSGAKYVIFPPGRYYTGITLTQPYGVIYIAMAAHGSSNGVQIVSTALSGPIVQMANARTGFINFAFTSSDERWNANNRDAHGILMSAGDISGRPIRAVQTLIGCYVIRQPGDAYKGIGSFELSNFIDDWAVSCNGHAFVFDDGKRDNYVNTTEGPFFMELKRCRAHDCGGQAFLIGIPGQVDTPINIFLNYVEALSCGWNADTREGTDQIITYGRTVIIEPDIEDQNFADSTTVNIREPKTPRTEPSGGIYYQSAQGFKLIGGYYSSLKKTFTAGVSSDLINIDVTDALYFTGNWSQPQPVGFDISSTVARGTFRSNSRAGVFIKQNEIKTNLFNIVHDGSNYISINNSLIETGIYNGYKPIEATINAGFLTSPALNIIVKGQSGVADTLQIFRYVLGTDGVEGHKLTLIYGGNDITINNSGNFLLKGGATSIVIDAMLPVLNFIYIGNTINKWVEL